MPQPPPVETPFTSSEKTRDIVIGMSDWVDRAVHPGRRPDQYVEDDAFEALYDLLPAEPPALPRVGASAPIIVPTARGPR